MDLTAFLTLMQNHVALFGIGLYADRLHLPSALVGAIARVDVHVERPKAKGTMVSGGVAQGKHFLAAMGAHESVVVFCKSFLFHFILPMGIFTNAACIGVGELIFLIIA